MCRAISKGLWVVAAVALLAGGCEFLEEWEEHGPHGEVSVTILSVRPMPAVVSAGDRVDLQARYVVRTRFPAQQVLVKERRQVFHAGHLMGDIQREVWRGRGTYMSSEPYFLPMPALVGWYRVVTTMSVDGRTSQKTMQFRVH